MRRFPDVPEDAEAAYFRAKESGAWRVPGVNSYTVRGEKIDGEWRFEFTPKLDDLTNTKPTA